MRWNHFLRSSFPLGKGIIVPCLAVLSVVCKYKCTLQKQVGLFSESHPVGTIFKWLFFRALEKSPKMASGYIYNGRVKKVRLNHGDAGFLSVVSRRFLFHCEWPATFTT